MPLPITAIIAGLCVLWLIVLQAKVIRFRRGTGVSLGDAGDVMGERLIRAHANAVENVPIFIILLGLSEGLGTPGWVLWCLGLGFLVARIIHGVHFFKVRDGFRLRFYGMLFTLLIMGLTAIGVLAHGLASL